MENNGKISIIELEFRGGNMKEWSFEGSPFFRAQSKNAAFRQYQSWLEKEKMYELGMGKEKRIGEAKPSSKERGNRTTYRD